MVEAHLDARLLGLTVLRIDGTVLLAPGHLVEPPRRERHDHPRVGPPVTRDDTAPGGDLARAARLLAENRARLAGPVSPRLGQRS